MTGEKAVPSAERLANVKARIDARAVEDELLDIAEADREDLWRALAAAQDDVAERDRDWQHQLDTANGISADLRAALDAAQARIAAVTDLFNGGPDTSIRTTWHEGVEYWEVPADEMREALGEGHSAPVAAADKEGTE